MRPAGESGPRGRIQQGDSYRGNGYPGLTYNRFAMLNEFLTGIWRRGDLLETCLAETVSHEGEIVDAINSEEGEQ